MTFQQLQKLKAGDTVKIRDLPRLIKYLGKERRSEPITPSIPYGIPYGSRDMLWDKDGVGVLIEIANTYCNAFSVFCNNTKNPLWESWFFHPILIEKKVSGVDSSISDEEYAQLFNKY